MIKIIRTSNVMYILITIVMCLIVLLGFYIVLNNELSIALIPSTVGYMPDGVPLTSWQQNGITLLALLNFLPIIYALGQLRGLFGLYRKKVVFSSANTKYIFNTGKGLFVGAVINIISAPIGSLILTAYTEHAIAINITPTIVTLLLAGGILTVIGWVMHEATQLSDDNAGFI